MCSLHLIISGLVQGVSFRASAQKKAKELGLKGWVKNLPDGCVEALAFGSRKNLEYFLKWCHQGPSGARVEAVEAQWQDPAMSEFDHFIVRFD